MIKLGLNCELANDLAKASQWYKKAETSFPNTREGEKSPWSPDSIESDRKGNLVYRKTLDGKAYDTGKLGATGFGALLGVLVCALQSRHEGNSNACTPSTVIRDWRLLASISITRGKQPPTLWLPINRLTGRNCGKKVALIAGLQLASACFRYPLPC